MKYLKYVLAGLAVAATVGTVYKLWKKKGPVSNGREPIKGEFVYTNQSKPTKCCVRRTRETATYQWKVALLLFLIG